MELEEDYWTGKLYESLAENGVDLIAGNGPYRFLAIGSIGRKISDQMIVVREEFSSMIADVIRSFYYNVGGAFGKFECFELRGTVLLTPRRSEEGFLDAVIGICDDPIFHAPTWKESDTHFSIALGDAWLARMRPYSSAQHALLTMTWPEVSNELSSDDIMDIFRRRLNPNNAVIRFVSSEGLD